MSSTTEDSDWNTKYRDAGNSSPARPAGIAEKPEPAPALQQSDQPMDTDASQFLQTKPLENGTKPASDEIQSLSPATPEVSHQHAPTSPSPLGSSISITSQVEEQVPNDQEVQDTPLIEELVNNVFNNPPTLLQGTPNPRGGATARRGRPSSRGGRRPEIKIEPPPDEVDNSVPRKINRGGRPRGSRSGLSTGGRPINRGGRPRGSRAGFNAATSSRSTKRKRRKSGHGAGDGDEDGSDMETDTSEEITALPAQSRSGRRITQANNSLLVPSPQHGSHSSSTGLGNDHSSSTLLSPTAPGSESKYLNSAYGHQPPAAKKRAPNKRALASAVCINCLRGQSPASNQIVFCDTCNTPWHQFCHDLPIPPSVIENEDAEWHCADCSTVAQEKAFFTGRKPVSEEWTRAEKRRYLEALDKAELVSLLLRASDIDRGMLLVKAGAQPPPLLSSQSETTTTTTINPAEPLVQPPQPVPDGAIPISTIPVPTNAPSTTTQTPADPTTAAAEPPMPKNMEFTYPESEPLPYPRAGNGVPLPSESTDADWLIDEDIVTYSHSWMLANPPNAAGSTTNTSGDRGAPAWTGAMGSGNVNGNGNDGDVSMRGGGLTMVAGVGA